ncbi:MAG: hypothetical protein AAB276_01060 [Pseudomonadota bacterium]
MIKHIFRMNAEKMEPADRMHAIVSRLWDIGYQYDSTNAEKVHFCIKDRSEPHVFDLIIVSKTGHLGALLPQDKIEFYRKFELFSSVKAGGIEACLYRPMTVTEFLAASHPHPFRSAAMRLVDNVRAMFVP